MTATSLRVITEGVSQTYHLDGEDVVALSDISIDLAAGERVALFGPSGSGKSTLLSLLAGLRRPTTGRIRLGDLDLTAMNERELLDARGRLIGVVVQNPGRSLLPYGTAEDNIRFAQRALPREHRRTLPPPGELLDELGLGALAGQRSGHLSGGEQQRLSIAVAVATRPALLLADEPTSQLDGHNRDLATELLVRVNERFGTTLAVVTHDPAVADAMHRRITLAEGRVVVA